MECRILLMGILLKWQGVDIHVTSFVFYVNSQCDSFIWENYTRISEYNLMRNKPLHRSLVSSVTYIYSQNTTY